MIADRAARGSAEDAVHLSLAPAVARADAEHWHARALELFESTNGASTDLQADLLSSARFFDPVAQGQRLRRTLTDVPAATSPSGAALREEQLPAGWLFQLPQSRFLLAPEGIAGMHALRATLVQSNGPTVMTHRESERAASVLLAQYKAWGQHRLRGVVSLIEGSDKPLQIQAAGTLLALLVNDSVGKENAIYRFDSLSAERRDQIDAAFETAVRAFTRELAPDSKLKSGGSKLISGWQIGEISRRLDGGLVSMPQKNDEPARIFVRPDMVSKALSLVVRDLNRGNRRQPTAQELIGAFDALVQEFRAQRGVLAGFGQLHESASHTQQIRTELATIAKNHQQAGAAPERR